jgi:hypothetical protein
MDNETVQTALTVEAYLNRAEKEAIKHLENIRAADARARRLGIDQEFHSEMQAILYPGSPF